jgi:hypothetical protein
MKRFVLVATAVIPLLAASAPAMARCEPADLEGRWALFIHGDNFETADFPFILGCTAILNKKGRVKSGSRCLSNALRATFEVSQSCTVVGEITLPLGNAPVTDCGISAAVTQSHEMISGVGECENDDIFLFNMVKR